MNKKTVLIKKVLVACVGILLVGIGVSFNAMAGLGNDPVGIFYDGMRNAFGLSKTQLGAASNMVNILLLIILFLTGRRYLNLGTLVNLLFYGTCVSVGTGIYTHIFPQEKILVFQILASTAGCLLLYTGVAIFISMDIGMDAMTGLTMVLKDRLRCEFKIAKWIFDGTVVLIGFLAGGKIGVITVITAITAGPAIQFIAEKITAIKKDI